MCDRAAIASNSVKGNYTFRTAYYEGAMKRKLEMDHEMLVDVKYGLDHDEFLIYLQPQCNIETSKIVGFEALVRWFHHEKGMLYPDEFIPVLENNGFILKLDMYVWEKVCQLLRNWLDKGYQVVPISVNISRMDLFQVDVVSILLTLTRKYDLDISLLKLEITESAYAKDMDRLLVIVKQLRDVGFKVIMDDFGSGYSSLNILKDIEIDALKIDMRFLYLDQNSGHKGTGIIESIINLARWMNLNVVAEGVENEEQKKYLSSIGCRFAQGYFYYQPVNANDFEDMIKQGDRIDYHGMEENNYQPIKMKDLLNNDITGEALLRNILGGIAMYDYYQDEIKIVRINDDYSRVLNKNSLDVTKIDLKATLKDDYPRFVSMFEKAKKTYSQGEEGIFRYALNNDQTLWIQIKVCYLRSQDGHQLFYGTIKDISEMQQLQQEREAFINSSNACIVKYVVKERLVKKVMIHKGEGTIFDGYLLSNDEEGIAKQVAKVIHREDIEEVKNFYRRAKDWQNKEYLEFRVINPEGEIVWLSQEINFAYCEDDAKVYYCTLKDVSELKQLKEKLNDSKEIIAEALGMRDDNPLNMLNNQNLKLASSYISSIIKGGVMGGYCEDGYPLYFASQNIIEYLGYQSFDELMMGIDGKIIHTIYEEDRARVHADIGDCYYEGLSYTTKYRMVRKDGSLFWAIDYGRVVRAENGKLAIVSVISDISEAMQLETKLDYLVNSLAGDIIEVNVYPDHYEMELIGQGLAKFLHIDKKNYQHLLKGKIDEIFNDETMRSHLLKQKKQNEKMNFLINIECIDNHVVWIDLSLSLVKKANDMVSFLGVTTDISEHKQSEYDLDLTRRYFAQLTHVAGLEIWEIEPETMTLKFFDQKESNYIVNSLGFFSDIKDFVNTFEKEGLVHEDSLTLFKQFINYLLQGYENLTCQTHFVTKNNVDIWVELNAGAYLDEHGKIVKILGSSKDITKEKFEDTKNKQIAKFLENVEKQSQFSYRINLSKDKILDMKSDIMHDQKEMSYSKYTSKVLSHVAHPDYRDRLFLFLDKERILNEYQHNYVSSDSFEYLRLINGEYQWAKIIYSILTVDKSEDIYAYTYVMNIHDEKQRELELMRKAQLDSLTGLLNRSTAKTMINQILSRYDHLQGCLFILDIDNFKLVNDCFGHVSGDKILIENAIKIKSLFRKDDIVCRLGGDEFIVMCNNISEENIIKKAKEICEIVCTQYTYEQTMFETSVSIGIAMIPEHGYDFDTLYHKADMALYESKKSGKKNFRIYQKKDE
ncbi:MAG: EAL domain-containing protein [Erysipelotrichia bacterium]|nr:EAL domain-containing protein [Erysipelotrichia bacterium]